MDTNIPNGNRNRASSDNNLAKGVTQRYSVNKDKPSKRSKSAQTGSGRQAAASIKMVGDQISRNNNLVNQTASVDRQETTKPGQQIQHKKTNSYNDAFGGDRKSLNEANNISGGRGSQHNLEQRQGEHMKRNSQNGQDMSQNYGTNQMLMAENTLDKNQLGQQINESTGLLGKDNSKSTIPGKPSNIQLSGRRNANNKVIPDLNLNDYSPTSHDLRHGKNPLSSVDDGDKYKKWNLLDLDTYDHQDMENRFNFSRIEKDRVHQMGEWKAKDQKGLKKSLYIREVIRRNEKVLSIQDQTRLEKINNYHDKYWFLKQRKMLWRLKVYINMICFNIVSHPYFETAAVTVIVLNCVTLVLEDPTSTEVNPILAIIDYIFLYLYTLEMTLKIIGYGFIFGDGAYLKESWNILDFIVVCSAWFTEILLKLNPETASQNSPEDRGLDLTTLRAFRVLRPLKAVSSIDGLKVLVTALVSSFGMLLQTVAVLVFFFLIFAIAGTQLMKGMLKQRCFNIWDGRKHPDDLMCGSVECPEDYYCGKGNENPNLNITNFDNLAYSMFAVFQCVTLEGWSEIQAMIQIVWNKYAFIYFFPMVWIGAFFLLNLTLAVVNSKFNQAHQAHVDAQKLKLEKQLAKKRGGDDGDSIEEDIEQAQEKIGLNEFIIGKRASKRIMAYMRWVRKKNHQEKQERALQLKMKDKEDSMYTKTFQSSKKKKNKITPGKSGNSMTPRSEDASLMKSDRKDQQDDLATSFKGNNSTVQKGQLVSFSAKKSDTDSVDNQDSSSYKKKKTTMFSSDAMMMPVNGADNKSIIHEDEQEDAQSDEMDHHAYMVQQFLKGTQEQNRNFLENQEKTIQNALQEEYRKNKVDKDGNRVHNSSTISSQRQFENKGDLDSITGLRGPGIKRAPPKMLANLGMVVNSLKKNAEKAKGEIRRQSIDKFVDEFDIDKVCPTEKKTNNNASQKNSLNKLNQNKSGKNLMQKPANLGIQKRNLKHKQNAKMWENDSSKSLEHKHEDDEQERGLDFDLSFIDSISEGSDKKSKMNKLKSIKETQKSQGVHSDMSINSIISESDIGSEILSNRKKNTDGSIYSAEKIKENSLKYKNITPHKMANGNMDLRKQFKRTHTTVNKKNQPLDDTEQSTNYEGKSNLQFNGNGKASKIGMQETKSETGSYKYSDVKGSINGKNAKKLSLVGRAKTEFQKSESMMDDDETVNDEENIQDGSIVTNKRMTKQMLRKTLQFQKISKIFSVQDKEEINKVMNFKDVKNEKKIAINPNGKYKSTSEAAVFERRINYKNKIALSKFCNYIKPPKDLQPVIDYDYHEPEFIRSDFDVYKHKVLYDCVEDKEEDHMKEKEQDIKKKMSLDEKNQPFNTAAQIAYHQSLRHIPIPEKTRKSDPLVTSTLSFTLQPMQKQKIIKGQAQMNEDEITHYINQKCAYKASKIKEDGFYLTTNNFSQNQSSTMSQHNNQFQSIALNSYYQNEAEKNAKKFKHQEEFNPRLYAIQKAKQEAIAKANKKRDLYNTEFDLIKAKELWEGKYHDEDDDNDMNNERDYFHYAQMIGNTEELGIKKKLDQFEIMYDREHYKKLHNGLKRDKQDEIPDYIREEFGIPVDIMGQELDFDEIRKADSKHKKKRPIWSGQDVLPQLNYAKSSLIIDSLSDVRVWPKGFYGLFKRSRVALKNFVRGPFFDNFMTLAVLVNTVVLAMDRYGIPEQEEQLYVVMNSYFTWIFIFELVTKVAAIGIKNYMSDTMNYLDGGVVLLSVVELIFMRDSDGASLSAFRTVRIFRTFRVLRVARLLRALKSMQMIMGVIQRSISSFTYITLLLLLFVFIYALLGMSLFGGRFYDPIAEFNPRGNYDDFWIAFITVFQVLTMENWQSVAYESMSTPIGEIVPAIFYITWIFVGNFILLNLFLAILLDSFLEEEDENPDEFLDEDEDDDIRLQKEIEKEKKKQLELIGVQVNDHEDEDIEDLDEHQIIDICRQDGLIVDKEYEKANKKYYVGIHSEVSLYVFHKNNSFRKFIYDMTKNKWFDRFVYFLIITSSFKLAYDTYITPESPQNVINVSNYLDLFFTIMFTLETCSKSISMGLIMDKGSYLREFWNQLDFFIVVSSLIDLSFANVELPAIKILRLLRCLRPLRFISHNVAMKMIVTALFESVGAIFNVMIVVMIVWLMFAILAVNLWAGKAFYCTEEMYVHHFEEDCLEAGGEWKRYDSNFDSVGNGMITLFIVSSLEGWPDIMYQYMDSTEINQGPTYNNDMYSPLFFIVFIFIGSYFLLNFFIGVLFLNYNQAQKKENQGQTDDQMYWVDIQKMIVGARPKFETTNIPRELWRYKVHKFVTSDKFDGFIMLCIVFNMVLMGAEYEGSNASYNLTLEIINYYFTFIFFMEMVLKMTAFQGSYFQTGWNRFDFFVVISSLLDLAMMSLEGLELEFLRVGPQIARIMRVMRVSRVLRLAGKQKGLLSLIQTISFSIGPLSNVLGLIMIIFFMFSILGCFFFGDITEGDVIDDVRNFQDWYNSFLLLFSISTGEDWNRIMWDTTRTEEDGCVEGINCGAKAHIIYFLAFILIATHIMLNLFILVILQQFDKYYLPTENVIQKYNDALENFIEVWTEFTLRYRCQKIKENDLGQFFKQLKEPLGMQHVQDSDLKRKMLKMGIKSEDGYIYFNELLYRTMKRNFGNFPLSKKLQVQEINTQYKIQKRILYIRGIKATKEIIVPLLTGKQKSVNPFLTVMYFNISFKTWLTYHRKLKANAAYQARITEIQERCKRNGFTFNEKDYEYELRDVTFQENQKKNIPIEHEETFEVTSEEDFEQEKKTNDDVRKKIQLTKRQRLMKKRMKLSKEYAQSMLVRKRSAQGQDKSRLESGRHSYINQQNNTATMGFNHKKHFKPSMSIPGDQ